VNLAATIELFCYGTSEGVTKSWDTRGRSTRGELEKKAIEEFGTTSDPREAGYILQDGTMLDFSGKRQGSSESGVRYMDHREVSSAFPDDADAPDFHDFMNQTGAIRFGMYGDDIQMELSQDSQLTMGQVGAIADAFSYAKEKPSIIIDICDARGRVLSSESLDEPTEDDIMGLFMKAKRNAWTKAHQ